MAESEKIKCRDVRIGDFISPVGVGAPNFKVVKIEEGAKIAGFLKARRLTLQNPAGLLMESNYGPAKPMRRRLHQ